MTLCDRKKEIFAFRPSVLTYQLSLYQHKQIYANPTPVVDQVSDTGGCSRCMSALAAAKFSHLILSVILFHEWFKAEGIDISENMSNLSSESDNWSRCLSTRLWHYVMFGKDDVT